MGAAAGGQSWRGGENRLCTDRMLSRSDPVKTNKYLLKELRLVQAVATELWPNFLKDFSSIFLLDGIP